jgi:hypothetical protein
MLCVVVVLPDCPMRCDAFACGSSDALAGALRQPFDRFYRCDAARIGSIAIERARFEPVLNELSLLTLVVGWGDFTDCCYGYTA